MTTDRRLADYVALAERMRALGWAYTGLSEEDDIVWEPVRDDLTSGGWLTVAFSLRSHGPVTGDLSCSPANLVRFQQPWR